MKKRYTLFWRTPLGGQVQEFDTFAEFERVGSWMMETSSVEFFLWDWEKSKDEAYRVEPQGERPGDRDKRYTLIYERDLVAWDLRDFDTLSEAAGFGYNHLKMITKRHVLWDWVDMKAIRAYDSWEALL